MDKFVVTRKRQPKRRKQDEAEESETELEPVVAPAAELLVDTIELPETYAPLLAGGVLELWQPLSEKCLQLETLACETFDKGEGGSAEQAGILQEQIKARPGPSGGTVMTRTNAMSKCRGTCPRDVEFPTRRNEPRTSIDWQLRKISKKKTKTQD